MKPIIDTDIEFICDIQAPCFQMLSQEEVALIKSSKTQVLFRKGDNLTKQGAFASYVLFLINGLARTYLEGSGSRNFNLRIIKPGEFLGLSSVFIKNTFNYSCVALTDAQAFLIEKDAIAKVAQQNGAFGFNLIKRYSDQNDLLYESLNSVIHKQMHGRLAKVLLYLDGFRNETPEIFQLLSRKELADFAGISTESAVKLLKQFEKDGFIKLLDKDILIEKKDRLIEISKKG